MKQETLQAPRLPEDIREEFRHRLAECLVLAKSYDGTEKSRGDVIDGIARFEKWAFDEFADVFGETDKHRLSPDSEEKLLTRYHPEVLAKTRTISGLLDLTTRHFSDRIRRSDDLLSLVQVQLLDGTILPTAPQAKADVITREHPFVRECIFSPRVRALLGALQERGIYVEDVAIYVGEIPTDLLHRQRSYVLIEIPRLANRAILVCDQAGEGTHVVMHEMDRSILLTNNKTKLVADYPDTVIPAPRGPDEAAWKARVMHLLFLDVQVGEKVDVALREDVRRRFQEKYQIEQLFGKKGVRTSALVDINVEGKGIIALSSLFGKGQWNDHRTLVSLRLLAEVYGQEHPLIQEALPREERIVAVQQALGDDREKWVAFLTGAAPVEVFVLGKRESISNDQAFFHSREAFYRAPSETISRFSVAGLGPRELSGILLSADQHRLMLELRKDLSSSETYRYLLAEALFGPDEKANADMQKTREQAAQRRWLDEDPGRWRAFLLGEEVKVSIDGQDKWALKAAEPLPTAEEYLKLKVRDLQVKQFLGESLPNIASRAFSGEYPRLKEHQGYLFLPRRYHALLLGKALYADSTITKALEREEQEEAVQAELGEDPDKWRAFIQGKPVTVKIGGGARSVGPERTFSSAEEIAACSPQEFYGLSFAGVSYRKLGSILLNGEKIREEPYARLRVILAIFPRREGPDPSWDRLAAELVQERRDRAVRQVLGTSVQAWKEFALGKAVSVELDGIKQEVHVENPLTTKQAFLSLTSDSRRNLRFAGLALAGFAARLNMVQFIPSGNMSLVYTGENYKKLADVLFDDEKE